MRHVISLLVASLTLCSCGVEDVAAGPDPGSHLLESVQELQLLTSGQGISPADGYVPSGFSTVATTGNGQIGTAEAQVKIKSGPWMVPVTVPVGTLISGFGVQLIDNGAPTPNTVKVELVSSTAGNLGSITSSGTGNDQGWTSTFGSAHTTVGGEMLWFRCSPKTSGGAWASIDSTMEVLTLFAAPPIAPLPAATYVTVPGSFFSLPDIHVGINGQVYQLPMSTGQFAGASITAQCSSGFIIACARIRERGTWDWCSPAVACSGTASATVPLGTPVVLGAGTHVDIALMSGPTVATSPFGIYTTL